mmetsp:Transcript_5753/g.14589  ORF Transcript_5753/g.14589 Transcript_5753/m.14589 type:complete len:220 (+) Transcript_5753:1651-2310(+)
MCCRTHGCHRRSRQRRARRPRCSCGARRLRTSSRFCSESQASQSWPWQAVPPRGWGDVRVRSPLWWAALLSALASSEPCTARPGASRRLTRTRETPSPRRRGTRLRRPPWCRPLSSTRTCRLFRRLQRAEKRRATRRRGWQGWDPRSSFSSCRAGLRSRRLPLSSAPSPPWLPSIRRSTCRALSSSTWATRCSTPSSALFTTARSRRLASGFRSYARSF